MTAPESTQEGDQIRDQMTGDQLNAMLYCNHIFKLYQTNSVHM